MKIPKSFKLFGNTITVEFDEQLCEDREAYGLALFKEDKIILSRYAGKTKISKENIECTFFHELVHFILNKLGKDELSKNEELTEQISGLLHQYIKTQKF